MFARILKALAFENEQAGVKFPPFAYRTPTSVEDAVEILASDSQAKVLAGARAFCPC